MRKKGREGKTANYIILLYAVMIVVALENGMQIFKTLENARILFIQHDLQTD
jgi:hypothetical protein